VNSRLAALVKRWEPLSSPNKGKAHSDLSLNHVGLQRFGCVHPAHAHGQEALGVFALIFPTHRRSIPRNAAVPRFGLLTMSRNMVGWKRRTGRATLPLTLSSEAKN